MKVQTKFKTGQEVFFMCRNKVTSAVISAIMVSIIAEEAQVAYYLNVAMYRLDEKDLFATKKELITSL